MLNGFIFVYKKVYKIVQMFLGSYEMNIIYDYVKRINKVVIIKLILYIQRVYFRSIYFNGYVGKGF